MLIISNLSLFAKFDTPRTSTMPGGGMHYDWGYEERGGWTFIKTEIWADGTIQHHHGCKDLTRKECGLHNWYYEVGMVFTNPNDPIKCCDELINNINTFKPELFDLNFQYEEAKRYNELQNGPEMLPTPPNPKLEIELFLFGY